MTNLLALILGAVLLVAGIVLMLTRNWHDGIAALVAAASLIGTSVGLLVSAGNEPHMTLCTSQQEINAFLRRFISLGEPVYIASYRLSWLRTDEHTHAFLTEKAQEGKEIRVFAAGPDDDFIRGLRESGIRVTTYPPGLAAPPRFTFLNFGKAGAQKMAVARDSLPTHWIDEYNDKHHPQVIALAKSYIEQAERAS